ncbi:MAG: hypothetical protein AAGF85_18425 [Bacteroidota bacterium]
MTAREQIILLFERQKELSVKEIMHKLDHSKQMIHLVIKDLAQEGFIEKLGRAPKTIYRLASNNSKEPNRDFSDINDEMNSFLDKNFILITEIGELLHGIEAFTVWCEKRNLPLLKTLDEFVTTKTKYERFYTSEGTIDGTNKLISTYGENTYLDKVIYLDFYAIERFGKTRLGTLLHFAKQGQNKFLMRLLMDELKPKIFPLIAKGQYEAVAFVPPTIRREVQIMKFIEASLNLSLPVIDLKKISGIIPVPQKSLSKLPERINNAKKTFAVSDQHQFNKVLLIDDAVGSGATLNYISEKLKLKNVAKIVDGLAVVGSFKGFDVITDI